MPSDLDDISQDNDISFSALAERFIRLLRTGKPVTIEEFASCYPDFKSQIHREFPVIELVERMRGPSEDETGPPATIGHYQVTCEIGRGGMGRVFSGFHQTIGRPVAIKIMRPSLHLRNPSAIERFDREARAAGKLNHPNIVQVFDHGEQDDLLYIVMQRVYGLDLARVISGLSDEKQKSGESTFGMDWQTVARIGSQVASALAHAHENGLIHRDIKPGNLMVETNGHAWVTDFGLVKAVSVEDATITKPGSPIGTPRYMAPEQMRGMCDCRSDIYGLGITLYELATGEQAWDSLSGREILARRSKLELQPIQQVNSAVPDPLSQIIMKCCAFHPEHRYQTAAELHRDFDHFLHSEKLASQDHGGSVWLRPSMGSAFVCLLTTIAAAVGFWGARLTQPADKEWLFKDPVSAIKMLKDEQRRSNFIATWADVWFTTINDPELQPVVTDLAKGAFSATLSPRNLSIEHKTSLVDRLTSTWHGFADGKSKMLSNEDFARLEDHVSNLARLQRLASQIGSSGMKIEEKYQGQRLILLLQRGLDEKRFHEEVMLRIDQIISQATNAAHPTDEDLRRFMAVANKEVVAIGGDLTRGDYSTPPLIDDLNKVFTQKKGASLFFGE